MKELAEKLMKLSVAEVTELKQILYDLYEVEFELAVDMYTVRDRLRKGKLEN